MRWNNKQEDGMKKSASTIYMRSKVDAIDYKYFIEPNIPKF